MTSRSQAKASGETRYRSMRPCLHGHLSDRLVSNGACLECIRLKTATPRGRAIKNRITRGWKSRNRERVLSYNKDWHAQNKEAQAAYMKVHHKVNADSINARRKVHDLSDLVWAVTKSLVGGVRTRSRRKGRKADPDLLSRKFVAQWLISQPNCSCCGNPFVLARYQGRSNSSPSIDRLDGDVGYTKANSRLICFRCNALKSNASAAELRRIADWMDSERAIAVAVTIEETTSCAA